MMWNVDFIGGFSFPTTVSLSAGLDKFSTDIVIQTETIAAQFDAHKASENHVATILSLIRSDLNKQDIPKNYFKKIPSSYIQVILYIDNIIETLELNSDPAYEVIRLIQKVEGIQSVTKVLREGDTESLLMLAEEVVEIKRKTESALSLVMTFLISYRTCQQVSLENELIFFCSSAIEKISIFDRHFSILLLCRGIFPPPYCLHQKKPHSYSEHKMYFQSLFSRDLPSLLNAYSNGVNERAEIQFPTIVRTIFPYMSSALHLFYTMRDRSDIDDIDNKIITLLTVCAQVDMKSSDGNGEDLITCIHRWLIEMCSMHFIKADLQYQTLPEEFKKNTVAMQLFCTRRAFCFQDAREKDDFIAFWAKMGNIMDHMISLVDAIPVPSSSGMVHDIETNLVTNIKKYITVVNCLNTLNLSNKLGSEVLKLLKIDDFCSNEVRKKRDLLSLYGLGKDKALEDESLWRRKKVDQPLISNSKTGNVNADDDLWAAASAKTNMKISMLKRKTHDHDFDLFYDSVSSTLHSQNFDRQFELKSLSQGDYIAKVIREYLPQLIAETCQINRDKLLASKARVHEEIEFVFSEWRRPHLLVSYYTMHSSTPSIINLYRRYLEALFGISEETVDEIRFQDPGNKRHFKHFTDRLFSLWFDCDSLPITTNETSAIRYLSLPGYNDPKTLFMLGEDCDNFLSIRTSQKGTNRGLLSILLHGSCRVLGQKDSSGRLQLGSILRLAIDDKTQTPVLHVDAPFGTSNVFYDDEYMFDKILEIYDQAAETGRTLNIPVIYAAPLPKSMYFMDQDRECSSLQYFGEEKDDLNINAASTEELSTIYDYTDVAPYIWTDGTANHIICTNEALRMSKIFSNSKEALNGVVDFKTHDNTRNIVAPLFSFSKFPTIVKQDKAQGKVAIGMRSPNDIEKMSIFSPGQSKCLERSLSIYSSFPVGSSTAATKSQDIDSVQDDIFFSMIKSTSKLKHSSHLKQKSKRTKMIGPGRQDINSKEESKGDATLYSESEDTLDKSNRKNSQSVQSRQANRLKLQQNKWKEQLSKKQEKLEKEPLH